MVPGFRKVRSVKPFLLYVPAGPLDKQKRARGGLKAVLRILGLTNKKGEWLSLDDGRLLAGSQAFYLVENRAFPVDSPAPWELTSWA